MGREGMEIVLGIFLMGILPVLFVTLFRKKEFLPGREMQRGIVYLLTLTTMCGVLLGMGNGEMALSLLLGSAAFHLLAVEGIRANLVKSGGVGDGETALQRKWRGSLSGRLTGLLGKMEGSRMFLAISFILLLFLSADYLFRKNPGQNGLGNVDGCVLILVGALYFIFEGNRLGWRNLAESAAGALRDHFWKKVLLLLAVEGCILAGSFLLLDGMLEISTRSSLLPHTVGFLFLSWCANFVNIDLSLSGEEASGEACDRESIFSLTVLAGICAACRAIYINTYEIYDMIILCLIAIILMVPTKKDSRFTGCCKVTAYLALALYILYR